MLFADKEPGPFPIDREEALRLVSGVGKSESIRGQMPCLLKNQLDFCRVSKRLSAVINFNDPDITTAQETKDELRLICDEIIQQMADLKAALA